MLYFKDKEPLVGLALRFLLPCGQLFGCSVTQSRAEPKQAVIKPAGTTRREMEKAEGRKWGNNLA